MAELFYHDVFTALLKERVRFVVVGGVAVNLQGVPRFTADVDVAVALEGPNLEAAGRALEGLGLTRNLLAFTFQDARNPLRQVDLLLAPPMPYEEIERTADRVAADGIEILIASIDVLIAMKTGTGRAHDESDAEALRRVRELEDADE